MHKHITFIGGGNMATSLIGGLLQDGHPADKIAVVEPVTERREYLQAEFNIACHEQADAVEATDVIVLAVKPQVMQSAARALAARVAELTPLVISIAAGIRCADLARWLGDYRHIVRCMPNTPALIQSGATGLYALPEVSHAQQTDAESVLRAVGLTLWVNKETQIDAITALSGSGPAYFFHFMEALQTAGEGLGLQTEQARLLTLQTALGAARMALESSEGPAELRKRVTSPGGTTEKALASMDKDDLGGLVKRAIEAAALRAAELADELGHDIQENNP